MCGSAITVMMIYNGIMSKTMRTGVVATDKPLLKEGAIRNVANGFTGIDDENE